MESTPNSLSDASLQVSPSALTKSMLPFAWLAALGRDRQQLMFVALVFLWAFELFIVQDITLEEHHYYHSYQPILHRMVRGCLDLLACGIMLLLMPRLILAATFVGGLAFYGVVLAYHAYADRSLSATLMVANFGEGSRVTSAGMAVLPPVFYLFIATLLLKLYQLHRLGWKPRRSWSSRWPRALKMGFVYLVIIVSVNLYKPFTLLLTWETPDGIGSVYGHTPTWIAELILLDNEAILKRANDRAAVESDRLSPLESRLPVRDRLVFVQVETWDQAVLGFEVDGREVTPRLNALRQTSMVYQLESPKETGSCDADFTSLMGRLPSVDMPNYKIIGFSFDDSFVQKLGDAGYSTLAVHNVTGKFFNRRPRYEAMGFDRLLFLEELELAGLVKSEWAALDQDMFRHAAGLMAPPGEKQFMIIITATSHVPFSYTPEDRRAFFPGSNVLSEAYLDAIHYVDESIGEFIDGLPPNTTVVIYGDHTSRLQNSSLGYHQLVHGERELVPLLIHNVGEDLSTLQKTRAFADSGELTLLDLVTYIHRAALDTP